MGIAGRAARDIAAFLVDSRLSLAVAAAAGVFMAFVGAFETTIVSLPMRLLLWVPMLMAGAVVGRLVGVRVSRRPRIGENAFVVWALTTLVVTTIVTVFAWAYTNLILGGAAGNDLAFFFAAVGLVTGALTAIMMSINRPGPATHAAPASATSPAVPIRFLDRMPEKLKGAALYAVQAEDHYLRLHTSKGSDLILMRLADAVAELEGIEGAQTHRSWWVAKDAVAEVKRADGRVTLALKNGVEALVSRPNVRALRESGWL
jgi:DNA-binding LytR/AlgR family response regulator